LKKINAVNIIDNRVKPLTEKCVPLPAERMEILAEIHLKT
jgi:hypothetical protein